MKRVIVSNSNVKKHIKVKSSESINENKSMLAGYEFAKKFTHEHTYLINALKEL